MSEVRGLASTGSDVLRQWALEKAAYGGTAAAGVLAIGGFFVDLMGVPARVALVVVAAGLAWVGFLGMSWRARRQESAAERARAAEEKLKQVESRLAESAPEAILDTLGTALFVRQGGWRVTLLVLERDDESWCLKPVITRASSEVHQTTPLGSISLAAGPLREVMDVDAGDPLRPHTNESANLPDPAVDPELWSDRYAAILQCAPNSFALPTRKFGWTVAKEPTSGRTLVLLCESVLPDGIRQEVARSQLIAPAIVLISRVFRVGTF